MAAFRPTQIPIPSNETDFEKQSVELFKDVLSDEHVQRLGTRGQAQQGVDIIGHRNGDAAKPVGMQCKLKTGLSKLTMKEVKDEIDAALGYRPALTEYFIVTTAKNDVALSQYASLRRQEAAAAGRQIEISVWGLDTLQEEIDKSPRGQRAFDPGFSPFLNEFGKKIDATLRQVSLTRSDAGDITALALKIDSRLDAAAKVPQPHADAILESEFIKLLQRRGFAAVDAAKDLAELSYRVIDGDLSLAAPARRAEVCDRAGRAQSATDTTNARRLRDHAAAIDPKRDLAVVDAYLIEAEGDGAAALRMLRNRRDADALTAMYLLIHRQRDRAGAIAWFREQKLSAGDLVPVGVFNLLVDMRHNDAFDEALGALAEASEGYFDEAPALRLLRLQFRIASQLPPEQRPIIFRGLPTDPRMLQLAGGESAQTALEEAANDIVALLAMLPKLGLAALAEFLEELLLWLRLEHPKTRDAARAQLAAEISDPKTTLNRVRLALAYAVPFNKAALQDHLEAQHRLGGWSSEQRFAAFLLTFASDDPNDIAAFIEQNYDELFTRSDFDPAALACIEVEALARSGDFHGSYLKIGAYTGRYFTSAQADDIRQLVQGLETGNEVEGLRKRFEASNTLFDLRMLISAIVTARDGSLLADYAPQLARRTKNPADFERAVRALSSADRPDELLTLVDELPELFALDLQHTAAKGWALYQVGRVMAARAISRDLLTQRVDNDDRELAINTAIETGDWGFLQRLVADAAASPEPLSVPDLVRLARLAFEAGSPYVDQLRDAALERAPSDPNVNLMAHILAIEQGDEDAGSPSHEWLQKASAHSTEDGPVKTISFRELVEDLPQRSEHIRDIGQAIRRGEMPLFVAGAGLNRRLLDLTWGQAIRNADPALSGLPVPIPSFVGHRPPLQVPTDQAVALDLTNIITLEYLGQLDAVLGHFERVVIAPHTLTQLFVDRQFLRVQQPSQIARAERLQALIADGRIKVLRNAVKGDPALANEIGEDLASLIAHACQEGGVVVRSAPVPRMGSFLDEAVSMDAHIAVLADTHEVLRFLVAQGAIDASRECDAAAYFEHVDQKWPGGVTLAATSRVYVDDLAATYLDQVGLLSALAANVAAVFVEPSLDDETKQTIRHGKNAAALLGAIERIRVAIAKGLDGGRINFSRRNRAASPEDEPQSLKHRSSTMDLLSNLQGIDVVVADDRSLTKGGVWSDGAGRSIPCATSLDLLATLRADGKIDDETFRRARHQLRASGFYPTPLEPEELMHHVRRAAIRDGEIRKTPELAAIRDSIALAQASGAYLPADNTWLSGVRHAFLKAIQQLWLESTDDAAVRPQSDWLLANFPDPTEWCPIPEDAGVWSLCEQQLATQTSLLLLLPTSSPNVQERYYAWLSPNLIEPMQHNRPAIWRAAVNSLKDFIARLAADDDD